MVHSHDILKATTGITPDGIQGLLLHPGSDLIALRGELGGQRFLDAAILQAAEDPLFQHVHGGERDLLISLAFLQLGQDGVAQYAPAG